MRHRLYTLDRMMDERAAVARHQIAAAEDNDERLGRMKRLLPEVMAAELTARQRQVIELYYYRRLNIPQIAGELGLNKSTVHRHLKAAHGRIRRALHYSI